MKVFADPTELQVFLKSLSCSGKTIGLIPTMGNLHAGHISLVKKARLENEVVVASIFINPSQFEPSEDFDAYPRTLEADKKALDGLTDILFIPQMADIYAEEGDRQTKIIHEGLQNLYCGAFRPSHFSGVLTIVNILFNLTQPDRAYFGKKDFQQVYLVESMVRHLHLPIMIEKNETIRAENGLALSSRNRYLTEEEREKAPLLYKTLCQMSVEIQKGVMDFSSFGLDFKRDLLEHGFDVQYLNVCDADTLLPPQTSTHHFVILVAVYLGKTRLIDNVEVVLD